MSALFDPIHGQDHGLASSPNGVVPLLLDVDDSSFIVTLRRIAECGELRRAGALLPEVTVVELRRAAYVIAWPIVYKQHTRKLELGKKHLACATSIEKMESDCLDRFHDDVEAVIDYLFGRAHSSIHNLEGWITTWLRAATVDGHRRRRGRRGAQQRPRVPKWLTTRLDNDPWLVTLAGKVIEWVGVPASAGQDVWPFDSWTDLRGNITGDWRGSEPRVVAREVDAVLTAMGEGNCTWYTEYIELPMGHKQAAVAFTDATTEQDDAVFTLTTRDDQDEANIAHLATLAVDAIASRLDRGEDPHEVIPDIVRTLFAGPSAVASEIDLAPHQSTAAPDTQLSAVLSDDLAVRRVITTVLDILGLGEVVN
jgi:hypothetical protein